MTTLILRPGASSLHFAFYIRKKRKDVLLAQGSFQHIGTNAATFSIKTRETYSESVRTHNHRQALALLIDYLHRNSHITALLDIHAVIYRIAHGGERFSGTQLLVQHDAAALDAISHLSPEGRAAAALVRAGINQLPSASHIGIFDTAPLPLEAATYAINPALAKRFRLQRYCFQAIMHTCPHRILHKRRIVSVVIDDEVSVAAVHNGSIIDATTGFTAAEGLPGLHRSGTVDPRIPLYLATHLHATPQQIDALLSAKSGLAAMTGKRSYAEMVSGARKREAAPIAALMHLSYRISQAVAAMSASLGGIDAIVFSGTGASWVIIEDVCDRLTHLGVQVRPSQSNNYTAPRSRTQVLRLEVEEHELLMSEAKRVISVQSSRMFKKTGRLHRK